jgi:hypothetical protein
MAEDIAHDLAVFGSKRLEPARAGLARLSRLLAETDIGQYDLSNPGSKRWTAIRRSEAARPSRENDQCN